MGPDRIHIPGVEKFKILYRPIAMAAALVAVGTTADVKPMPFSDFAQSSINAQEPFSVQKASLVFDQGDALEQFSNSQPRLPQIGESVLMDKESDSAPESTVTIDRSDKNVDAVWDEIAELESRGDWSINTGNGHYGGLQFTLESWHGVGGTGLPSDATREEQIMRGKLLLEKQGWKVAWPNSSRMLGLQ